MKRPAHLSFCHTGRIRTHGIGGGHKQKYRMIDFQRLSFEPGKEAKPFDEKVVEVRYDPCRWAQLSPHCTSVIMHDGDEHVVSHHNCLNRSADIALVAGGNRKRWIIATENMQAGDIIKTSGLIGRMAGTNVYWWLWIRTVCNWHELILDFFYCTLQSQPMRVTRTRWELFLWARWWTTWRYNQGRDQSTFVLQVMGYAHFFVVIDKRRKLFCSGFDRSWGRVNCLDLQAQVAFCSVK